MAIQAEMWAMKYSFSNLLTTHFLNSSANLKTTIINTLTQS